MSNLEPYAWMYWYTRLDGSKERKVIFAETYKTSPKDLEAVLKGKNTLALYTSPQPSKQWMGLTDEEMDDCWNKLFGTGNYNRRNVYRDIEAKLKEKNT